MDRPRGARVGKTLLCRSLDQVEFFDCELPRVRQLLEDAEDFLRDMRGKRVILDEIHRLPTEAEWEKAARGGLAGRRFPWGDTITHYQANYCSYASIRYDKSWTRGFLPKLAGTHPLTSPVGSFDPNGYGLYDMAGNVWEWTWDWYDKAYCASSLGSNPRGPAGGEYRVLRGGGWYGDADSTRSASSHCRDPDYTYDIYGFRCVRGP